MAGPMVFYKDYIEFIEGYHILKHAPGTNVRLLIVFNGLSEYFLVFLWGGAGSSGTFYLFFIPVWVLNR